MNIGSVSPSGAVTMQVLRGGSFSQVPAKQLGFLSLLWHGMPRLGLTREVFMWRARNIPNFLRGLRRITLARLCQVPHFYGQVSLVRIARDGQLTDFGLASLRVVTTTGVGFLVDSLQNIVEPELLKFHGIGTGAVAEAVGDTALGTELTTQYNPDNTRATGSLTESAANVFRTVGTNTVDAAAAVTEHGILTQAATGGGVLLDRSVFSVINLANGDSLQSTYDLTLAAGS